VEKDYNQQRRNNRRRGNEEEITIEDAIRSVCEALISSGGYKRSGNCICAFEGDKGENFTLCVFNDDDWMMLSRHEYDELVETRRKYNGL